MAHRSVEAKKRRRVAKAIRRRPLPAWIDLIHWLKLHGYAETTGQAVKILLAKRVVVDSHPVGFKEMSVFENGQILHKDVVDPYIKAEHRGRIIVKAAA